MMAASSFQRELNRIVGEEVVVELKTGKKIRGLLKAVYPDTLAIILSDVAMGNEHFSSIVLSGDSISAIYVKKGRVDMDELRLMLEKIFPPRAVVYRKDLGVIIVMDKIRVTEKGVEGEPGLVYDRVKKVYEEYISRKRG